MGRTSLRCVRTGGMLRGRCTCRRRHRCVSVESRCGLTRRSFCEYYPEPSERYEVNEQLWAEADELGYWPSKSIGLGDDLPIGMGREWTE